MHFAEYVIGVMSSGQDIFIVMFQSERILV